MAGKNEHLYGLIMAGGSGTRLWPKSREKMPKQFQKIVGNTSLLQQTYRRMIQVVEPKKIFISTSERYKSIVLEQLPTIDKKKLILEPMKRNTGPGMGLAALYIVRHDPRAEIIMNWSDHVVLDRKRYGLVLKAVAKFLKDHPKKLVTIGIPPTFPSTGLGYIKIGDKVATYGDEHAYSVDSFVEKPDYPTAQKYLMSKKYLWNTGYFCWRADYLLELFERHTPDIAKGLKKIGKSLGTPEEKKVVAKVFATLPDISIDYCVAEKNDSNIVFPADLGWSDIGSWAAVYDQMKLPDHDNYIEARHLGIDTKDCLIQGADRLIATVGIENLVVVDTGDVILVAHKDRSQDVKKIVDKLKENGYHKHL